MTLPLLAPFFTVLNKDFIYCHFFLSDQQLVMVEQQFEKNIAEQVS